MKKIAIASAAMGGAALIAFGASGTFAAFSDSENVNGTVAQAGALNLVANGAAVAAYEDVALVPGETTRFAYVLTNDGDVAGLLSANVNVTDVENGRTDPEIEAGDYDAAGDLSQFATVRAYYAGAGTGCNTEADVEDMTPLGGSTTFSGVAALVSGAFTSWEFAADATHCVVLEVGLPMTGGAGVVDPINQVQGDSVEFNIAFTLKQDTSV